VDIAVLAKHVPNPSGRPPEIGDSNFLLRRGQPDAGLDPSDETGLELAVRLAEQTGGRATVVSMGPEDAIKSVWRAMAFGAEDAVLVTDDALRGADALATARVLAAAITRRPFDVVIAGVESTDGATGTMPATLAELLELPCASFARKLSLADGAVTIERQTATGYDIVECTLPAVVTVTAGAAEARYPSLRETIQAKKKPVERLTLADLGLDPDDARVTQTVVSIDIAPEREAGVVVDDAADGVDRILGLLREAGAP
jgi:electron transfer flavoprotein beta subunit